MTYINKNMQWTYFTTYINTTLLEAWEAKNGYYVINVAELTDPGMINNLYSSFCKDKSGRVLRNNREVLIYFVSCV